jgi:hypothetical protein
VVRLDVCRPSRRCAALPNDTANFRAGLVEVTVEEVTSLVATAGGRAGL